MSVKCACLFVLSGLTRAGLMLRTVQSVIIMIIIIFI